MEVSSHGAQSTTGHISSLGTSNVSPQHPSQVCIVALPLVSLVSVEPVVFVESVVFPVEFVLFDPLLSEPDEFVL